MRRPVFIARQSGRPRGVIGRVIAAIMARETAPENAAAIALLDLEPADRVLELGFGHGRALAAVANEVPLGHVAGVDHSELMLTTAGRRCRRAITEGRVRLHRGDGAPLPFADASFDKAYSVHTIYFWPEPGLQLAELRRVLRPGGLLVLGLRVASADVESRFPREVYRFRSAVDLHRLLEASGFVDVAGTTPAGSAPDLLLLSAHAS